MTNRNATALRGQLGDMERGIRQGQRMLRETMNQLEYTAAIHGSVRSLRILIDEVGAAELLSGQVLADLREVQFDNQPVMTAAGNVKKNPPHLGRD